MTLVVGTAEAASKSRESRAARERAARAACLAGDYAKGVDVLSELFLDMRDPVYIYNQGRCFEQGRRYEDAIARFQEYQRAARTLTAEETTDVRKHISDCKELLAADAPATVAAVPPEPAVPPPHPAILPQPLSGQVDGTSTPPQPLHASATNSTRVAGIVVAAAGGAALLAGIAFNLKANSLAKDMIAVDGYTSGKASDRKTYETLGWAGYGLGAACLATGMVLYLLGSSKDAGPQNAVSPMPLLSPGQAGAVLKGAF